MNVKDGYAMQLAIKKGYNICVISGGLSDEVQRAFTQIGYNLRIYEGYQ